MVSIASMPESIAPVTATFEVDIAPSASTSALRACWTRWLAAVMPPRALWIALNDSFSEVCAPWYWSSQLSWSSSAASAFRRGLRRIFGFRCDQRRVRGRFGHVFDYVRDVVWHGPILPRTKLLYRSRESRALAYSPGLHPVGSAAKRSASPATLPALR